ncbi:hypothetical protein [Tropicibacter naphthalenivorans]|uniref:hypothetical protein n=1 Tax=Tropicibacter naphthalenivorans TaxID=441103 RepID=UPI001356535C|nr:hypothetical protein [Tropicibacter naphthalenivorans]
MSQTTIATLPEPSGFSPDQLTDLIHNGARKLMMSALKEWRKLDGQNRLPKPIG